jgi:hypothetical protein
MKTRHGILAAALIVGSAGCATFDNGSEPAPLPTDTSAVAASEPGVIPAGQQLDVRLQNGLSSETARVEQQVEATTLVDLTQNGEVLVPAGSMVRGIVTEVSPAGKLDRSGSLTLAFDRLSVNGRTVPIRAMATRAFESRGVLEEEKVGAAGAAGAIIGGILGGLQGALIGAAVGAGGVVAATDGEDVELPQGTIVRLRIDEPVRVANSRTLSGSTGFCM